MTENVEVYPLPTNVQKIVVRKGRCLLFLEKDEVTELVTKLKQVDE